MRDSRSLQTGPRPLREHQVELVDAAVRALEPAPGQPVPANGLRAMAVSACGTGKTIAAAHVAQRIAPFGRLLVLVPTLELLTQTVRKWRFCKPARSRWSPPGGSATHPTKRTARRVRSSGCC